MKYKYTQPIPKMKSEQLVIVLICAVALAFVLAPVSLQGNLGRNSTTAPRRPAPPKQQIHYGPKKVYTCPGWTCHNEPVGTECYLGGKLRYKCHDCHNAGRKIWKDADTGYTKGDCHPVSNREWNNFGKALTHGWMIWR